MISVQCYTASNASGVQASLAMAVQQTALLSSTACCLLALALATQEDPMLNKAT